MKIEFYSFGLYIEWFQTYDDGYLMRHCETQNTLGMDGVE